MKISENNNHVNNDRYFRDLAIKYCIITITTILSTFVISITFGYFDIMVTGPLDSIINANCIL